MGGTLSGSGGTTDKVERRTQSTIRQGGSWLPVICGLVYPRRFIYNLIVLYQPMVLIEGGRFVRSMRYSSPKIRRECLNACQRGDTRRLILTNISQALK